MRTASVSPLSTPPALALGLVEKGREHGAELALGVLFLEAFHL